MPETIEETVMRVAKESNGIVYGNIALLARRVQEALEPPLSTGTHDDLIRAEALREMAATPGLGVHARDTINAMADALEAKGAKP